MQKKMVHIGRRTTKELKDALQKIADKEERSLSKIIEKALKQYVKQQTQIEESERKSANV